MPPGSGEYLRGTTGTSFTGGVNSGNTKGVEVIGILIAVLVAALVYAICVALGLPSIVGIVAAILVLLAGIPTGGYGFGDRWGHRRV
jgi:hypothetical protein